MPHPKLSTTLLALPLVLGLAACSGKRASSAQLAALHAAAGKEVARVEGQLGAWRSGVRKLAAGPLPLAGGSCAEAHVRGVSAPRLVVHLDRLAEVDRAVPDAFRSRLGQAQHALRWSGPGSKLPAPVVRRYLADLARPYLYETHPTLVVRAEVLPRLLPERKFEPGIVRGRLLVWSHPEARFVCAADVEQRTGDEIKLYGKGDWQRKLVDALYIHAEVVARRQLQALR